LEEDEVMSLFRVARMVARRMMKSLSPEFVCMYARGRRIPHTHIFLIPTAKDDVLDRFFNALERFQESPPNLMRLRDKGQLKEALAILREAGYHD
jgi:histidine triad (HIT) family protein